MRGHRFLRHTRQALSIFVFQSRFRKYKIDGTPVDFEIGLEK